MHPSYKKDKKILIVDFDNETSENLSKYLSGEGFQASIAKDGQSGLEKFNSEKPDLIVLEPMLPKIHGFDLCKNMFQNSNRKIPVVFTTEFYGEDQCKRETTQSGSDIAYFKKPYNSKEVLSSILELLGNRTIEKVDEKAEESYSSSKIDLPKKETKPELFEEIDKMLQETLSEFGMNPESDELAPTPDIPSYEKPSLPPEQAETQEKKDEKLFSKAVQAVDVETEEEEEEEEEEEKEEEEDQQSYEEFVSEEEKQEEMPKQGLFGDYAGETNRINPKPFTKRFVFITTFLKKIPALKFVLPVIFLGLVAGGSTLLFLESNNKNSLPLQKVSQSPFTSEENLQGTQLANLASSSLPKSEKAEKDSSPDSAILLDASEKQNQEEKSASTPETEETPKEEKSSPPPAPNPPPKASGSPESTEPVLPDSPVYQDIGVSPEIEAKAVKLDAQEHTGLSGDNNSPEEKNQNAQSTPEEDSPRIKTGDIVALSLVDTPPILIKRVQPKYPPSAKSQGIEDSVMLNALISEKGKVEKTVIIKGDKAKYGFNEASENAVRQWRFKPAVKDGIKVKVWKPIMIVFKKNK